MSNYTEAPTIPPIIKDEDLPEICLPYNPPKPDFSAPGKRISEAKCDEYVWQLKIRQKNNDRSKECQEELDRLYPNRLRPAGAIGGRDTVLGEFPHMGAIGWLAFATTYVFKCGSSLISSRFVLTAAHCSRASDRDSTITDPVPKVVRLGDKNIINSFSGGLLITDDKIVSIIVHPQYAPPKKYYDIALMKLENEVHFTKYTQPACMWTKFDTSSLGPTATLTGWGVVETHGKTTSPELQAAVVDLIDSDTCNQLLKSSCNRNWCGVRDDQLCAGKLAGGVDACQVSML
ncbi:hypothetical protein HF086_014961 [Spodoptera exigua]|uniref:Peptidase S1 domain-containing protein n=1 Tax=Spodoptera exigua TaxID=7107 RepID=A0A922MKJ8_SPOEX|nr:hypothetical protein HF086_014961 [Spodoptera exigua]